MKFKQWLLPILIIGLAYGLGQILVALKATPAKRPPVNYSATVEVMPIQLETLTLSVDSQGNVQPKQHLDLISEVNGAVQWVADELVEGGLVKQGQVLLHIDPMNYQVALAEAEASLAKATLSLKDEQAEYKRGTEFRSDKNNTSLRQHKLAQVEAEYNSAKQRVRQAEQNLEKTYIKAPFDAVINQKSVEVGQFISSGNRLLGLLGTKAVEVRLPVTAAEISYLRINNGAAEQAAPMVDLVARFGQVEQRWSAQLVRIENRVDADTRVFYAVAEVSDPYQLHADPMPLSIGLFIEAHIEGKSIQQAVRIPYNALHENNEVFLVVDGKVERRKVKILRREKQAAVVIDGLKNGDQVVLTRLDLMVEGMSVSVINLDAEPLPVRAGEQLNNDYLENSVQGPKS